ncbi:MAG: BON domain-containing protein [Desulfamplus sp.]|nr:BON domain-containing protein [Desulfamplus sp.]
MKNRFEVENEDSVMEAKTEVPMFEVKPEVPHEYTNAWLAAKVKATLLSHRNVNATRIEVFAAKGTITLRGKATSRAQKDLATEYAKDVEGVKNVENEMKVQDATTTSDETTIGETVDAMSQLIDDASITVMVKTKLLYNRSTSAINTIVETNGGVVKLSGIARNAAEKDLAAKLVNDVHGVKKVINNIIVEVSELQTVA